LIRKNLVEGLVSCTEADQHHKEKTSDSALGVGDLLLGSISGSCSGVESTKGEMSNSDQNQANDGSDDDVLGAL